MSASRYERLDGSSPSVPSLSRQSTESLPPAYMSNGEHEASTSPSLVGSSERDRLVEAFLSDDENDDQLDPHLYQDDRHVLFSVDSSAPATRTHTPSHSYSIRSSPTSSSSSSTNITNNHNTHDGSHTASSTLSPAVSPPRSVLPSFLSSLFGRGDGGGAGSARRLNMESNNNDGVFANITAKPSAEKPDEEAEHEEPPSYETAAADQAPPYWDTTIIAPGMTDEPFIDGLPVGSVMNFFWNTIVSAAFQFVGFFLTYLLHTSHAAKHGSRAGLGFTLLQCGFYLQPDEFDSGTKQDADNDDPTNLDNARGRMVPNNPNSFDVSSTIDAHLADGAQKLAATAAASSSAAVGPNNNNNNDYSGSNRNWLSIFLMVMGTLLILKAVIDYLQARRMERALLRANSPDPTPVSNSTPEVSVTVPAASNSSPPSNTPTNSGESMV